MAEPVPLMSQGHNDQQFGYEGAQLHFVISLTCFSFKTLKKIIKAFLFFFLSVRQKGNHGPTHS